jgi:hypothetical protein
MTFLCRRSLIYSVRYKEDEGKPHWYPEILNDDTVTSFIEAALLTKEEKKPPKTFTLTVVSPAESGSLFGWEILEVKTISR